MASEETYAVRADRLVVRLALLLFLLGLIFLLMNVLPLAGWCQRWSRQQFLKAHTDWRLVRLSFSNGSSTAVCDDPGTIAYVNRSLHALSRDDPACPRFGGWVCRTSLTFESGDAFPVRSFLSSEGLEFFVGYGYSGPGTAYSVPFKPPLPPVLAAMVRFIGDDKSRGTVYFGPTPATVEPRGAAKRRYVGVQKKSLRQGHR